jgi:hypothetical protein
MSLSCTPSFSSLLFACPQQIALTSCHLAGSLSTVAVAFAGEPSVVHVTLWTGTELKRLGTVADEYGGDDSVQTVCFSERAEELFIVYMGSNLGKRAARVRIARMDWRSQVDGACMCGGVGKVCTPDDIVALGVGVGQDGPPANTTVFELPCEGKPLGGSMRVAAKSVAVVGSLIVLADSVEDKVGALC